MPTVHATGLQVIGIYVTDLERAKAFYINQLGCAEGGAMEPGVLLQLGEGEKGITIYLESGRAARDGDGAGGATLAHPAVSPCLAVESVKAAHDALEEAGVPIVGKYNQYGDEFAMFRIADPDGNVLEFAGKP